MSVARTSEATTSAPTMNPRNPVGLLTLPAEILNHILEYVFDDPAHSPAGFTNHGQPEGLLLDDTYSAPTHLRPLLTCRRLYASGHLLALHRTTFVIPNLFASIPTRLSLLNPKQVSALRSLSVVVDARHFRKLRDWDAAPFGCADLALDTLTLILHRSSFWHYLFDFTADLVTLLRTLRGVRRLVFVRNAASVKGSFKTWYHRLVGLIMKVDHRERYERHPPKLEATWWAWRFEEGPQRFVLEARPGKRWVEEEEDYLGQMAPLLEELRIGMEGEEWNPDPRARNGT